MGAARLAHDANSSENDENTSNPVKSSAITSRKPRRL